MCWLFCFRRCLLTVGPEGGLESSLVWTRLPRGEAKGGLLNYKMLNKNFIGMGILAFGLLSSGCSVGMALSGKKEPDLAYVQKGASRKEIEHQLGKPISSTILPDGGRENVYDYELGNKPSAGKAAGYFLADILTFGLNELISTPIEAAGRKQFQITVIYDKFDNAVSINQPVPTD